MTQPELIQRRMLLGGACLALYGGWVVWARLPEALAAGLWTVSALWTVALFAGAGTVIGGLAATLALAVGRALPHPRRPVAAAVVETVGLVAFTAWLLVNELVYTTTREVLGPETFALAWNNPTEVFEGAWEMGGGYLLTAGGITLAALGLIYTGSIRSFRHCYRGQPQTDAPETDAPETPAPPRRSSTYRLAGSMTGGLLVLSALLGWQIKTTPGEALTTVLRSAPPLRALNLTRAVMGVDLAGSTPAHFGAPIITDDAYRARVPSSDEKRPNVITILLESVPATALHCYGHAKPDVTPYLDALAAEGVRFEHCWAAASFSAYGVVSTMTSLYMLRGERYDYFKDTEFPFMGLPRALKLGGYQLVMFSSGNESFDNISRFYPPADFDVFFSRDQYTVPWEDSLQDSMRMDDKYAVTRFETWLADRADPRPFYAGLYLQATHFNYEVPEPWYSHDLPVPDLYSSGDGIIRIPPETLPKLRNQYDNAMRYGDHWVGRIRDALEQAGELDNTIIVAVGDHGEGFMQHGLARHGVHVWEEMIHVPLIVYVGASWRETLGRSLPSVVPDTVSMLDIAPTVARLARLEPHPSWQGRDVLAPGYTSRDRPVFSLLQLTRWQEVLCINRLKYVYDLTDIQAMLFDLAADPGETNNLIDDRPELAAALKEMLGGWHVHQLHYYDKANRPFTHYIGRYEPDAALLRKIHDEPPRRQE